MNERTLRFVRTLALLGGAAGLGCGARTDLLTEGDGDANPDVVLPETSADTALPPGQCLPGRGMSPLICAAGRTCDLAPSAILGCIDDRSDVGPRLPCGTISCAEWCSCSDAASSTCSCILPVEGPLPPPDLVA
jgi:hypothetical protein